MRPDRGPEGLSRWWDNLPLARKGLALLLVPAVFLTAGLLVAAQLESNQAELRAEVNASEEIDALLDELLRNLRHAQVHSVNFVVTRAGASRRQALVGTREVSSILDALPEKDGIASGRIEELKQNSVETLQLLETVRATSIEDPRVVERLQALERSMLHLYGSGAELRTEEHRVRADLGRELEDANKRQAIWLWASIALGLLGGLFTSKLFTSSIASRLRAIQENARRLADEEPLIPATSARDEIAELDRSLAYAAGLLEARSQKLQDTSDFLEGLISTIPGVFFKSDQDYIVHFITPHVELLTGWTPEEVIGSPTFWQDAIHPDDLTWVLETASEALARKEELLEMEFRMLHKGDGTYRWVRVMNTFSYGQEGSLTIAGYMWDISDRKAAEEALIQSEATVRTAMEAVESASLAKSDFLSRMSHELRTPLNSIIGFSQLLEMDDLAEDKKASVLQIKNAGKHLLDMINEILDISRIEEGRMSLSIEPLDLDVLLEEATSLVGPLADERNVTLSFSKEGMYVQADRQRLKQVLLNLLSNAIKYNRVGGRVSVEQQRSGDLLVIGVSDTGRGIPPERIARLFRPFDRLGLSDEVEGTGLGLALTRGLIEHMGGKIEVKSELGVGSTFSFELPLADSPAQVPQTRADDSIPPSDGAASAGTILYIEDNAANVKLVEKILARRPGVRLIHAMQGSIGLDLARKHMPDLIFLDLNLPDMNGQQVLHELRANLATRPIPVNVVTADATPGRMERLLESGADGYVTKPLDVAAFLELVDSVLQVGSHED